MAVSILTYAMDGSGYFVRATGTLDEVFSEITNGSSWIRMQNRGNLISIVSADSEGVTGIWWREKDWT